jgi:serine/threonine protein kinase
MTDADVQTRRTGELLDGRYRLESKIGSGGMASVYRGVDEMLGRPVAIKLFHPGTSDPGDAARKTSETRVLASLNHHALVTLFDARLGADDNAYLVMEHVDGPTLAQRITHSPVPVGEVALMAADLADALTLVHETGIVHRDLKPSNILLRPTTTTPGVTFRAKLADFGIAYLIDSTRLTTPGTLIGTAAYLSPEQVSGGPPATPADIYALGLVLIEALTGHRVFPQGALHESILARLDHSPAVPAEFGADWASLLTEMTARTPADRPTASDVATAVASISAAIPAMHAAGPATVALTQPLRRDPITSGSTVKLTTGPAVENHLPPRTLELRNPPLLTHVAAKTSKDTPVASSVADLPAGKAWRWRVILVAILIVALIGTGIILWAIVQSNGTASAPELPEVPEPLGSHLKQLLREVTP